jgi:hypothetical protein
MHEGSPRTAERCKVRIIQLCRLWCRLSPTRRLQQQITGRRYVPQPFFFYAKLLIPRKARLIVVRLTILNHYQIAEFASVTTTFHRYIIVNSSA